MGGGEGGYGGGGGVAQYPGATLDDSHSLLHQSLTVAVTNDCAEH